MKQFQQSMYQINNAIQNRQSDSIQVQPLTKKKAGQRQMQLMHPDQLTSDKISSSVKKSHKISMYISHKSSYSKRSTKSPKKNEPQSVGRIQQPRDFPAAFMVASDKFSEANIANGVKYQQNYVKGNSGNEHHAANQRNMNFNDAKRNQRGMVGRQQSYQQSKQQSDFFESTAPLMKKANTLNQNAFPTNSHQNSKHPIYINQNTYYNNGPKHNLTSTPSSQLSVHNISQMIDKQAESQTNNLSILEGSFMTGVRNNNFSQTPSNPLNSYGKNNQSQNSQSSQQQMMTNFMKLMQEQIYIAKQKCEKRVNQILKGNAKIIQELKNKLFKNEAILKEKTTTIEKMKQAIRKGNANNGSGNRVHSEGQINVKRGLSMQQAQRIHNNNPNGYYERRVADLQGKLSVLQSTITQKTQNKDLLDIKIQRLEKQLLSYTQSKLKHLSLKLQSFVSNHSDRMNIAYQSFEKLRTALQRHKHQLHQNNFNQNLLKELKLKLTQIQAQLQDFTAKEFKYENYNVPHLQEQLNTFKQQLRKLQNLQFENSKLVMQFIASSQQRHEPPPKLITLSNINETSSKYTFTNPNMSKISISELSNTNEYSHLIEKMSPNEKHMGKNYHNTSNNTSESLISMNFTEDPAESITPRMKTLESGKYPDKHSHVAMSKYTKNTDFKETCSQLQATPPSASKYYLPNTKTSISIHSIIAPNESSTQQKIRNLNDLKMQTLPQAKQNPQKTNNPHQPSAKKSIYHLQQSIDNNASYLSIGQMQDFNISRRDIANQTSDFSDDEFFYPGYREDHVCEWHSPEKSYKTSERFLEGDQFSPMRKKLASTEQHFYQSSKSPDRVGIQQSREKHSFMYNSSFDYERFSEDEEDEHKEANHQASKSYVTDKKESAKMNHGNCPHAQYKLPQVAAQSQQMSQVLTENQERVISAVEGMGKEELPVKVIYDRKKIEGVIRTLEAGHPLNGKVWALDKSELSKLQALGYVQVKTYL